MSISTSLTALQTAKTNIANAITAKGGTVGAGDGFSDFAADIGTITGGGAPVVEAPFNDVNFYDYDGTRLFSYTLAQANALTALPTPPTHEGLTFQEWNYTLAQVKALTQKQDVGASYITSDGKTHLLIEIPEPVRLTIPLYWSQTVANGVTIDWGDGTATQTFSGTGNKNTTHTYATAGKYDIALSVTSGYLGFSNGATGYSVLGSTLTSGIVYTNKLKKAYVGAGVTSIGAYAFTNCYSLSRISIPSSVTSIGTYAVGNCYSLSRISIPSSVTSIGTSVFYNCYTLSMVSIPNSATSINGSTFTNCYSLSRISIPSSVTSIGTYAFQNNNSLTSVIIPIAVTSIENNAFQSCYGMKEYYLLPTTPPTLGGTGVFTNIPSDCTIYVPVGSLDAYKTATNWSAHASKMKEIGT